MKGQMRRKLASRRHAPPRARWWYLFAAPLLAGAVPPTASPVTISAFLLSSETGELSPDAMTHPDLLGNAVAGAASAHAALIRVKVVSGRGTPLLTGARIRLIARVSRQSTVGGAKSAAGRLILDRTVRLGPATADGTAYAGFWLDDVGCAPIALDATVLAAKPSHGHADLGFQCYE